MDFPHKFVRWKQPIYAVGGAALIGGAFLALGEALDYRESVRETCVLDFNSFGKYILRDVGRVTKLCFGGLAVLLGATGIGIVSKKIKRRSRDERSKSKLYRKRGRYFFD